MRWLPDLAVATRLRLAMALVALLFALYEGKGAEAAPWIALVATIDLSASVLAYVSSTGSAVRRAQILALLCANAFVAGVAMGYAGPWSKVLIIIPAFHAGLRFARRGLLIVLGIGIAVAFPVSWWAASLD